MKGKDRRRRTKQRHAQRKLASNSCAAASNARTATLTTLANLMKKMHTAHTRDYYHAVAQPAGQRPTSEATTRLWCTTIACMHSY